jgi:thymidylate synthase
MNKLDKQYTDLLQDILDNGVTKSDRTGTGTLSVFGRQIKHNMKDGFPLLTGKKMFFKGVVTELLWFLRGDTNIKFLVDNGCHIWDGDCYQVYLKEHSKNPNETAGLNDGTPFNKSEFIALIQSSNAFAKKWGELGPIYGKQWRNWDGYHNAIGEDNRFIKNMNGIDQIQNLINDLKTNPDSRRLMVNAWNVGELGQMVLPPCHYGFQVYTRELSLDERTKLYERVYTNGVEVQNDHWLESKLTTRNIPTRAISLMWNQRSVDTGLGLPFNIASYGLLLEIIAKEVNMVPDELIGNLGDVHLYNNHIEPIKEQIGREMTTEERNEWHLINRCGGNKRDCKTDWEDFELDQQNVPKRTREPYPLPTLKIVGYPEEYNHPNDERLFEEFDISDFELENYQSHPAIKLPLSN